MSFRRFSKPGIAVFWAMVATASTVDAQVEPKVAVVLSGGAAKGSFEVGALRFLFEGQKITAGVIAGTSVGAINAAKLAEGGSYERQRQALSELEQIWFSLRNDLDMYVESKCFFDLKHTAEKTYREVKNHIQECKDTLNRIDVWNSVDDCAWLAAFDFEGALYAIRDKALKCDSLFTLEPIRTKLGAHLSESAVRTSGARLRLVAVSLESGRLFYATEEGLLVPARQLFGAAIVHPLTAPPGIGGGTHFQETRRVSLRNAVIASAAIPVVFPPEPLGDPQEHFIDGGVRDVAPLDAALLLDPDVTYVIGTFSLTMGRWRLSPTDFAMESILRRSIDVMVSENSFGDLVRVGQAAEQITDNPGERVNPLTGKTMKFTVILPEILIHDGMTIEPGLIRIAIGYGYLKAADVVLGGKWPGAEEIAKLRKSIWVKENQLKVLEDRLYRPGGKTPEQAEKFREEARKKIDQLFPEIDNMKAEVARKVALRREANEESVPPAISQEWDPKVWSTYWERHVWDRGERRKWGRVDPNVVK